jgi:archaellum component FlaC
MKMQKDRIQKLITFSPHLYTLVEKKAEKLGISFPEYIRILAVSDIKEQVEELPMVDEETEKKIAKSLQDIKEGRYTTIKNEKDLEAHLKSL